MDRDGSSQHAHTDYLELIAVELERLRILKEYEFGVEIKYEDGDLYIEPRSAKRGSA